MLEDAAFTIATDAIHAGGYQLPVFPFRDPPELQGVKRRYPVVVVGGGLVGLTAACDLASRGIEVVLLDDDDTVGVRGASSRGICYAQRSLELFERLGIYDRMRDKGVTWSVGRLLVDNDEIFSFDLADGSMSRQPPFINLQQFYVEWFLVDRLAQLPTADVRWRSRVTEVQPNKDHVALTVETPAGVYLLEADWVVDASGLSSLIRDQLGLETNPARATDRWCIADVRFKRPQPPERWVWVRADFNAGRAVWQHPLADDVWRIDYQMPEDMTLEEVGKPEIVADRVRAHLGEDAAVEPVWVGPWGYRTHLLENFRCGRIFFAGDSAHVFSPFGARGGNSGIQDAENIAWKLNSVIKGTVAGEAAERLLDSYNAERQPAAALNIAMTEASARFVAPRGEFENLLRDSTIELARKYPPARDFINMGRMSTPYVYHASPIVTSDGSAFPNIEISVDGKKGSSLVELLSSPDGQFVVLAGADMDLTHVPAGAHRVFSAAREADGVPHIESEHLDALLGRDEVVILRPDQHVAARLLKPDTSEIAAALKRAAGGRPAEDPGDQSSASTPPSNREHQIA